MEKAEAKIYFPDSENASLEDQYEDQLFEWKQFFVHRFPVTKLYQSKLNKINQIEAAYVCLSGISNSTRPVAFDYNFQKDLKSAFLHFEKERSRFKQMLFQSESLAQIAFLVESFLECVSAYAKVWYLDNLETEGVLISKESDPMDLLGAIEEAEKQDVRFKNDLSKLPDDHLLIRESKRLSLWLKMDTNG